MKKLYAFKLFFFLTVHLLSLLITNTSLAIPTTSVNKTLSNTKTPNTSKLPNNTHTSIPIDNTISNIISSKIGPAELDRDTDTTSDFFVKIGDQVVPIDYTLFSSQETSIKHTSNYKHYPEIANINLCADDSIQIFTVCDKTTTLKDKLNIQRVSIFNIDKQKLTDYIKSLSKASKKISKNAVLAADTEGVITVIKKEEFGYELDTPKILENVLAYFNSLSRKKIVSLPIKTTTPTITSTNYKELGLKEKIGTGKSNFRGSPKNRIHNIHNATNKFEGIIIAPNETFSFVENLGDVDESTGYKEELVIKDNKTFPEFGGGICQVSTTLFRSAVNTGLEITERRNHAYPVQYYSPQGTDATIYIPKPDLQFRNNTTKYILLQPHIEGTILTFDIIGTSDGRQVETEGPTLLKRGEDGSKKYVWWQIVNDKDGNQISKKGFWSYYQDAAKFHEGNHDTKLTSKPKDWSGKQWKQYKREHGM